jgi:hypothetical protein
MFRRFGSEVIIIEMAGSLIQHEDEDVSLYQEILERENIHIRLNAKCIGFLNEARTLLRTWSAPPALLKSAAEHMSCWLWAGALTPTTSVLKRPASR